MWPVSDRTVAFAFGGNTFSRDMVARPETQHKVLRHPGRVPGAGGATGMPDGQPGQVKPRDRQHERDQTAMTRTNWSNTPVSTLGAQVIE